MKLWWCLLLLAAQTQARDVTDEEYAQFPRLFHLDEWESCLARPGGLYCLGTFSVEPLRQPNPLYNMLKEYSKDPHHFNRTALHRGYCVSSRCPGGAGGAGAHNASLRFERCAAQWAQRLSLRARLLRVRLCRSRAQHVARAHHPPRRDHRLLLLVLAALLLCNVAATAYDVLTGDNANKCALVVSWSVRSNWRRLTASYDDGDPRLAALSPVQGIRVFLMLLIMATHSGCIHDMLYLYNPRWIEQISRHPVLMIFLNGTSVVQVFVLLSNFLLAYNLLLYCKDHSVSFRLLPYITIKRIARISPVHLVVVGYAATWWASAGSGPQWAAAVGAESDACRRKFWTHVFYLNNLIDPEDICLVQTWFLAVDMQLYVLASVLSLLLARHRSRALPVLAALVLFSCVLNGVLAYVFHWKSIVYFAYPSNLRTMYAGIPSFSWLYQAPWGSLPACLIGLFLAFLHFEMQEAGVKLSSYRWVRVPYLVSPALMVWWIVCGGAVRSHHERWFTALYAALERPVLSLLAGGVLIGMVNGLEGWLKQIFSWRGFYAPGRLSLSVLLLHWCINLSIAASRPQPINSSLLSVVVDWLATSCLSYAAAVPLTLLLEMPAQRTVTSLFLLKQKQA